MSTWSAKVFVNPDLHGNDAVAHRTGWVERIVTDAPGSAPCASRQRSFDSSDDVQMELLALSAHEDE